MLKFWKGVGGRVSILILIVSGFSQNRRTSYLSPFPEKLKNGLETELKRRWNGDETETKRRQNGDETDLERRWNEPESCFKGKIRRFAAFLVLARAFRISLGIAVVRRDGYAKIGRCWFDVSWFAPLSCSFCLVLCLLLLVKILYISRWPGINGDVCMKSSRFIPLFFVMTFHVKTSAFHRTGFAPSSYLFLV